MMTILNRYIAKTVILSTLLVVIVVMALTYFIGLLGELRDIGSGDYGLIQAAMYALLELPHNLYQFYPMLVLLGGLMGLGALASHQELVVIRVSGVSIAKILRYVFSAALVLAAVGVLVGELVAPRSHYLAEKHKSIAESGGQAVATQAGLWVHEGDNFLHIDRVMARKQLEGVTRYEFDAHHQLLASYFVKKMDYDQGQWQLHDVVKTIFTTDHTRHEKLASSTWDLALNPALLNVGLLEPDEMPLTALSGYTHHLVANGLQAAEFQFNFWKRVFQPLTILVMLFLAVPFVFAAPRSASMGLRMLLGAVVGFVFYILNALLGQLSIVFQFSPILAALFPILLFAGVGYLLLLRQK